ncbi:MAG: glycosyltransferase family 2 protein [Alphaproteobacteria bacterium]|nr:glycosyltransferase family 2 protein [Alphaproteobacteria bacterium]
MKMVEISVIVPVYNAEKYLLSTLQSIFNQTFKNFEVICVNDGSTDDSLNLLKKIKDKRLRIINQRNQGVSVARNVGVRNARGKWISFFDADDLMMPTFLEKMLIIAKENNTPIVCCDYRVVAEEYNEPLVTLSCKHKVKIHDNPLLMYLKKRIDPHIVVWNKLYLKEFVERTPFVEKLKTSEDRTFIYQIFSKINKISHIEEDLVLYRESHNSLTRKFDFKMVYMHIEAYQILKNFFDKNILLHHKLRKKNNRIFIRWVIYKPYRYQKKKCLLSWKELSEYFERKKILDIKEFNFFQRILLSLLLKKRFKTLLVSVSLLHIFKCH